MEQGNGSLFWIYFWYYYLLFAIVIGGAPIPEETMLPIYFMLAEYTHLIMGIIGAYLIGMFLSMLEVDYLCYSGHRVGYIYFLLFSSILYFRVAINHKQYSSLTKARIDDVLLALDSIELL